MMKGFKLKHWIIPVVVFIGLFLLFRTGAFSSGKNQLPTNNTVVNIRVAVAQLVNTVPNLMLNG